MAAYKDYYKTLGVPRTATADELKKSFRKLAREHHPDVAKDKKKSEEKFKEKNEAYEVLSDPTKRKKYDELGADWKSGADFRPPPGHGGFSGGQGFRGGRTMSEEDIQAHFGGTGFSDFFEQMFGARRGGRDSFAPHADVAERGHDVEGDILVTLQEAATGSIRSVTVQHGNRNETHQVRIPAGVTEGQKLRLSGRGASGSGGGEAGDLYLNVRFAKHPDFDLDGHDLVHELELAPWEAALGAEVSVPTLDGRVKLKIAAGTQSGQKLRVRNRGLPLRDGTHGDLIVVAQIAVPAKLSDAEKKLWEQLARESKFNPRT
jgi:curved DNA-binding protein